MIAGVAALPPLWGAQSYNWGAGMHRIGTAADFIYENLMIQSNVIHQAYLNNVKKLLLLGDTFIMLDIMFIIRILFI